jgi:hypothetical protein
MTPHEKAKAREQARKRSVANLIALKDNPDASMSIALSAAKKGKAQKRKER